MNNLQNGLSKDIEDLNFDTLNDGYQWFIYKREKSRDSYAVRYTSENNYTLINFFLTFDKQFFASNKDDLIHQVLSYFKEKGVELGSIKQDTIKSVYRRKTNE